MKKLVGLLLLGYICGFLSGMACGGNTAQAAGRSGNSFTTHVASVTNPELHVELKDAASMKAEGARSAFSAIRCNAPVEVIDGDTVRCNGATIRVLGMDAAELAHGNAPGQEPWGTQGKNFAQKYINGASEVWAYTYAQCDPYKRQLAHILLVGGILGKGKAELLSVVLIENKLAHEGCEHYGPQGFVAFCERIMKVWNTVPRPEFEAPYKYKGRYKKQKKH